MRSTLDELTAEVAEIRALVSSITPVNAALAEHQDTVVRHYLSVRRRFDYAAFIVALYATFEKFAENLVAGYARLAALRSKYDALPTSLTRKHMSKSADLLVRARLGEGRYVGLRELDVVKNLHDCLSGANPYALNEVAIVAHDLNLRYDELGKLFAAVGIEHVCERARRTDPMVSWFSISNDLAEPLQNGVPTATVQQRLDDLVERRNQVTHRGGSPVELLGTTEMTDMVAYIEALSNAVFTLAVANYLRGRYVEPGQAAHLRLCEGPYRNGSVVVVERPERRLYVGQPVFVVLETIGARWGRVLSLRVDNASVPAVEQAAPVASVGVELDFKCPRDAEVFVLDTEDEVVWSPN